MSGAVNPNTLHSSPVCTMFNEIAQYLKFFKFFLGVAIMTSNDDVIVKILCYILKETILILVTPLDVTLLKATYIYP